MSRLSLLGFINTERTRMPVRKRLRSRGVPTALQGREILCTHDHAEATEAVSALLGLGTLDTVETARDEFQTTLNAIRFLDVTMAYLDFRAPTRLTVHRATDAFTVHMTTHDSAEVVVDGTRHEVSAFTAFVNTPPNGYVMHLGQDCPQLIIRIERRAVERQLSRMLGRSLERPIVFDPVANLTTDEAVRWHSAIQLLSSEVISSASLIQQGLGAASLEELIVSTLLYIQPSNYFDRVRHARNTSGRVAVRRSIEYVDEHLAERISMADLAEHARVSIRSIQTGFREDLGTTPVAYIRDRRLDKVRQALMEAIPSDGITVARVAERWGFANAGSFSVRYRERFGESPSQTLRR